MSQFDMNGIVGSVGVITKEERSPLKQYIFTKPFNINDGYRNFSFKVSDTIMGRKLIDNKYISVILNTKQHFIPLSYIIVNNGDFIGQKPNGVPPEKINDFLLMMNNKSLSGLNINLDKGLDDSGRGRKPLKDSDESLIDNTAVDDSIVLKEYDSIFQALKSRAIKVSLNNSKFAMGISTIGFVGGLGYAYKKGSGFWGYVGWSFLGSILGSIAGGGIDKVATDTKSDSNKIITTELRIQANALLGKTKDSKNALISKKYFDLKSLINTLDND